MPTKILVVDDSATMRKILEMTFAGEDAEVLSVPDGESAIQKATQMVPDVVFADVSMSGVDAYGVAHAIKNDPALTKTAVIALASQHNPYDEAKGQAAGVDAHTQKPFDTQALIDLTGQVLRAPRAVADGPAPAGAPKPAAPAAARPAAPAGAGAPPPPPGGAPRPAAPAAPRDLRKTAAFGEARPIAPPAAKPVLELADEPDIEIDAPEVEAPPAAPTKSTSGGMPRAASRPSAPVAPPAAPAKPAPPPAAKPEAAPPKPAPAPPAKPAPAAPAPAAPAAAEKPSAPSAAIAAASGSLEQKLAGLDLSKDQVEAVLALSREVIEQVVWEVVPDLAEALIKEEIARLTRE